LIFFSPERALRELGPQLYQSLGWSKPDKRFRKAVEPLLRCVRVRGPKDGWPGRTGLAGVWAGRCLSYAYRYDEAVLCMIATNLEVWEAVLCVRVRAAQKTAGQAAWAGRCLPCYVRYGLYVVFGKVAIATSDHFISPPQ